MPDEEPPIVEILKPIDALYFFDQEFFQLPFPIPIALGALTVDVTATDNRSDISKVEIFIDDALKTTMTSAPYSYYWDDFGLFIYNLRVVAYDSADPPNYTSVTKAVIKIL